MRICKECQEPITDGQFYANIDGDDYCTDCLQQMSIFKLMDLVGYPVKEMCGSSAIDIDDEDYVALMRSIKGGHKNGYQTA